MRFLSRESTHHRHCSAVILSLLEVGETVMNSSDVFSPYLNMKFPYKFSLHCSHVCPNFHTHPSHALYPHQPLLHTSYNFKSLICTFSIEPLGTMLVLQVILPLASVSFFLPPFFASFPAIWRGNLFSFHRSTSTTAALGAYFSPIYFVRLLFFSGVLAPIHIFLA